MTSIIEEIETLKRENDAVLLAHYYVEDEVQAIAIILQRWQSV